MTDEHITPSADITDPVAELPPTPDAPPAPPAKRGGTPLWLTVLLVAAVGAEPFVIPRFLPDLLPAPTPVVIPAVVESPAQTQRIAALEAALAATKHRLDALEAAPHPVAVATADGTSPPVEPSSRLEALETRLATLEKQPAMAMPDVAGQVAAASAALEARVAALDAEIQKDVAQATARASNANRLRAASAALESGQMLGDIPGAGPELTRFATTAAPTEPALRLSFPRYEEAARAASQPLAPSDAPLARAWERVQALVTIRHGDKVLIGSQASVFLEEARGKVDAGDLAGAVTVLGKLDRAALDALAPWLTQAKSLLDARAALLALVAKS
jgi:hypothetical protein